MARLSSQLPTACCNSLFATHLARRKGLLLPPSNWGGRSRPQTLLFRVNHCTTRCRDGLARRCTCCCLLLPQSSPWARCLLPPAGGKAFGACVDLYSCSSLFAYHSWRAFAMRTSRPLHRRVLMADPRVPIVVLCVTTSLHGSQTDSLGRQNVWPS
jgi:hypothetical protein